MYTHRTINTHHQLLPQLRRVCGGCLDPILHFLQHGLLHDNRVEGVREREIRCDLFFLFDLLKTKKSLRFTITFCCTSTHHGFLLHFLRNARRNIYGVRNGSWTWLVIGGAHTSLSTTLCPPSCAFTSQPSWAYGCFILTTLLFLLY